MKKITERKFTIFAVFIILLFTMVGAMLGDPNTGILVQRGSSYMGYSMSQQVVFAIWGFIIGVVLMTTVAFVLLSEDAL